MTDGVGDRGGGDRSGSHSESHVDLGQWPTDDGDISRVCLCAKQLPGHFRSMPALASSLQIPAATVARASLHCLALVQTLPPPWLCTVACGVRTARVPRVGTHTGMCLALQLLVIKRTGEWQGPSPPLPLPFTHPSRLNVSTSPVWFEILFYLNSLSCD